MFPPYKPNPHLTLGDILSELARVPSPQPALPPLLPPPNPVTSPPKDLKSPVSKKWNRLFYMMAKRRLAQQTKQRVQRIRTITNGLTMPEITAVPLGSAKKMTAAILFFDLQNFTTIASKLSNELVLYALNTIVPEMMYVVRHWNGEIEKNTGDGLMAVFGTETRNNFLIARDAIEAAMTMRYLMLAAIREKLVQDGLPAFGFRIGLDMEEVLVSRIGIKNTNFLTVVGSAANRASKLQELAGADGICIGENLYRSLHPNIWQYCQEGKHADWNWTYTETKAPYRFFHYTANWLDPF